MNKVLQELSLLRSALEDPVARLAYTDWLMEQGREEESLRIRYQLGLVRQVKFRPSRGTEAMTLLFLLYGPKGVVQFLVNTGWHSREATDRIVEESRTNPEALTVLRVLLSPLALDLGYHSPIPMYEDHEAVSDDCEFLNRKPCYYDGSGYSAMLMLQEMIDKGDVEAMWKRMEEYYRNVLDRDPKSEEVQDE